MSAKESAMAAAKVVPVVDEGRRRGRSGRRVFGRMPRLRVTMCGHGERAVTAARVLERSGRGAVAVLSGGPGDWASVTGQALEHVQ